MLCFKTGPRQSGTARGFIRMSVALVFAMCFQTSHSARIRGRHYASKGCEFPSRWTGMWFQKGVHPPITIEKDVFSFKGKCHDADEHMFFIEDSKEKCFRCVVMYEKHPNVLQYRETYCDSYATLRTACAALNADAILYSLFRVNSQPVSCQLRGPFTFSYSRGGRGECKYPVSTIDSCTDDSRLLFRFQACADVMGTESSVEELSCLALWKEGAAHYLVGKMSNKKQHNPSFADDNAYRCFVFEFLPEKGEIQMSQNSDATCDGLVSPWEGARTMRLKKIKHPTSSCRFPTWVTTLQEWQTLDGQRSYLFSHKSSSFKVVSPRLGMMDTKFICIAEMGDARNTTTFITHGMVGCESGYACVKFYRRHKHIMELQMGNFVRSPQEACHSAFTDYFVDDLITLVAPSLDSHHCPNFSETNGLTIQVGKFSSSHNAICGESLSTAIGCQSQDMMRFLITCASYTDIKSFHCHGFWEEDGRSYLVTTMKDTQAKYCFVYRGSEKTTHVSGIRGACQRTVEPGITGNFTFNISSAGECDAALNGCVSDVQTLWTLNEAIVYFALAFVIVLR